MLGIGRSSQSWQWGACGKHPVARDYVKIGAETPAFDALESWIQKGYAALPNKGETGPAICSWRFWTKGIKKGELVCGIAKDSCDTIGRPYPLLITGSGKLDGWEKHWECLPLFFEKHWETLEYMTSRRLEGIGDFEKALRAVKSPENNPKQFSGVKENLQLMQGAVADDQQARITAGLLSGEMMTMIPINVRDQQGSPVHTGSTDAFSQAHGAAPPNAIFIGGAGKQHYLAVFRRPLNTEDFVRLWMLPTG